MKALLFVISMSLVSFSMLADNHCQRLERRLDSVKTQLRKRTENFRELQFQKNKLEKKINKKCVGMNKKLEDAFMKSSFLNE